MHQVQNKEEVVEKEYDIPRKHLNVKTNGGGIFKKNHDSTQIFIHF